MTPLSGSGRQAHRRSTAILVRLAGALGLVLVLLAVSVAVPHPARAESRSRGRVLVGPASGRNLSAAMVLRARAYLLSALSGQCPACLIVDGDAVALARPLDVPAAWSLALRFSAPFVLSLDVDHAPGLTRFTLRSFRTTEPDGQMGPPATFTEATADGPEAISAVVNALVFQFLGGARAAPLPATSPSMTPAASTTDRPLYFVGAALGVLAQLDTAGKDDRLLPAYALSILRRGTGTLMDARLEVGTSSGNHRTTLGLSYAARVSPNWSLGLAASWAWMNLGGRGASGPAATPIVSYMMTIPGGPAFRLEFGYALNLFKEQEMDRLIPGSDRSYWSHGPQLLFGVYL